MFFLLFIINSTIPRKRHAISFPFYSFIIQKVLRLNTCPPSVSFHQYSLSGLLVFVLLTLGFSPSVIQLTQLWKSSCIFLFHKTHDTLPFCSYFWIRLGNLFNIPVLDIRHMEFYNGGYRCAHKINMCTLQWLLAAVIANAVHICPAFTRK